MHINRSTQSSVIKKFKFQSFEEALEFVNRVGRCARDNQYYPDLDIDFNEVKLTFTPHESINVEDFLLQVNSIALDH